ncbi:MAG: hypothetical protein KGK02_00875 [Rhodospirillales bacterium]|nr:hypothetical protein [Rhodospirillales bacterium]
MSLVELVNKRIIAWIRRDAKPVLVGDEIILKNARLALKDSTDIVAYEADIYAGGIICLLLSFPGGKLVNVNQEDACWNDLLAALDRLGLTQPQSPEWILQILSCTRKAPVPLRGR